MPDHEKVMRGLELCSQQRGGPELCEQCAYYNDPLSCSNTLLHDALALLREQEREIKGLRKLVEWAVECDFGYDNLGDWWVDRFKSEIDSMSYTEGLIHLAKRYIEVFEEDSEDAEVH